MRMRHLALVLAGAAAIAGVGAVARLPTEDECRASGRMIDPTRRHCVDGAGFVQLREHVMLHVTGGASLLLVPVFGALLFCLARRRRTA
jgi:hypothetical protein